MKRAFLLFFFMIVINYTSVNAQCSMCRAALQSSEDQEKAKSLNDGIVYLMAIPYILVGTIAFLVIKKKIK